MEIARKIYGLLELLAEDKITQRDAKQRADLREIVGDSTTKQKSVFLMDGTKSQADICRISSVNQGNLSTMVGKLAKAKLLGGDVKKPQLAISIPSNFFEAKSD